MIERFMKTMKEECIWLHCGETFTQAKRIIEDWIRECNVERPHQEIGYQAPVEFKLAA